jgi:hypothetical protein
LGELQTRLAAAKPPVLNADTTDELVRAASAPLFGLTGGPGSDVQLRLDGLAITPGSKAALISINGKPADWLDLGATRDGVTLLDVQPLKVTLDTATGFKEVTIEQGGPEGHPAADSQTRQPAATMAAATPAAPMGQKAMPFAAAAVSPQGVAPTQNPFFRPAPPQGGMPPAQNNRRFGPLSVLTPGSTSAGEKP